MPLKFNNLHLACVTVCNFSETDREKARKSRQFWATWSKATDKWREVCLTNLTPFNTDLVKNI